MIVILILNALLAFFIVKIDQPLQAYDTHFLRIKLGFHSILDWNY